MRFNDELQCVGRLIVVDASGVDRLILDATDAGGPFVSIFDANGNRQLKCGVSGTTPKIELGPTGTTYLDAAGVTKPA